MDVGGVGGSAIKVKQSTRAKWELVCGEYFEERLYVPQGPHTRGCRRQHSSSLSAESSLFRTGQGGDWIVRYLNGWLCARGVRAVLRIWRNSQSSEGVSMAGTLDNPKSAILRSSRFSPHRMFSGFRSRCTMPRSCKYATDSSNGRISLAASSSVNLKITEKGMWGEKERSSRGWEAIMNCFNIYCVKCADDPYNDVRKTLK